MTLGCNPIADKEYINRYRILKLRNTKFITYLWFDRANICESVSDLVIKIPWVLRVEDPRTPPRPELAGSLSPRRGCAWTTRSRSAGCSPRILVLAALSDPLTSGLKRYKRREKYRMKSIENKLSGIYNAVSPYTTTNAELTKAIAKTLEKPLFLPNIPCFMMKIVLGEMHQILFSSQNVSCRKLLDENFQFQFAALDKALNNLLK